MRVRRTGGRRGGGVVWYVWADGEGERRAMRVGLLEERAPDGRWRYVLAWGFGSRAEAEEGMEGMREEVEGAVVDGILTGGDFV